MSEGLTVAETDSNESENKPADCMPIADAAKLLGVPPRRLGWAAHANRIAEYSSTKPFPGRPGLNQITFEVSLSEARKYLQSIGAIE